MWCDYWLSIRISTFYSRIHYHLGHINDVTFLAKPPFSGINHRNQTIFWTMFPPKNLWSLQFEWFELPKQGSGSLDKDWITTFEGSGFLGPRDFSQQLFILPCFCSPRKCKGEIMTITKNLVRPHGCRTNTIPDRWEVASTSIYQKTAETNSLFAHFQS